MLLCTELAVSHLEQEVMSQLPLGVLFTCFLFTCWASHSSPPTPDTVSVNQTSKFGCFKRTNEPVLQCENVPVFVS